MFLNHLLSCTLFSTAALGGVVTLYGANSPSSDRVECSVPELQSQEIAMLLSFDNTDEIAHNGTTTKKASITYDVNIKCGGDYAHALALECSGIGGDPTCLTGRNGTSSRRRARTTSEQPHVYYCTGISDGCHDTFEANQLGLCPSGYRYEHFSGQGSGSGSWCSKTCTKEQKDICTERACEVRRKQCELTPKNVKTCRDALEKCGHKGPIKMDKSICNGDLFQAYTAGGHKNPNLCQQCADWKDGKCYLNVATYDKAAKKLAQIIYGFMA